ncbi:MAG: triose-phosphate isomerase [Candidatus Dormibacteria bacterium]
MPRRALIAGNWKMHKTAAEAAALTTEILALLPAEPEVDVLLLPPYPCLQTVHATIRGDRRVQLGAQDCHWEDSGAFTGEVSAGMLAAWCQHVLVGHSERRRLFHESDDTVRAKLEAVLRSGMDPILAVGETEAERRSGETRVVLVRQARAGLLGLAREQVVRCTVAYEPVWAIGTGAAAEPGDIAEAAQILRGVIEEAASGEAAEVRILYGGSVTPESAPVLLSTDGVAGALVGGASLSAPQFCGITAAASR